MGAARPLWLATSLALAFALVCAGQQLAPPPSPPPPPPGPMLVVPGNEQLLRQQSRVDSVVLPYEDFRAGQEELATSNIIDHKRFVEPYSSRCFSSTLLADPDSVEPSFVIVRAGSEVRVNATAPLAAIRAARFEPRHHTTILVHGFTQSYPQTDWLRRARALYESNGLLARENLVIMDWGAASHGSYAQVAAQVSGMGAFLANFLMKLLALGARHRAIHLVGHSLGAHLAGFAGKRIRPQLGRITALDPAGPCFGKLFSNSPNDRLARQDAHQVDVLHYDDDFLGLASQLGHFDVYVNGGASQPGAVDNMNAMMGALVTMVFRRNRVLSESHTRSTEVATAQLAADGCQQMAYECADWPAFMAGECGHCDAHNSQCFLMSHHYQYSNAQPVPLRQPPPHAMRLYVATSATEPYCLNHFQVLVHFVLAPDLAEQARRNRWRLQLELANERNERANLTIIHLMEPDEKAAASERKGSLLTFSYLLQSEMAPSRFARALLLVRSGKDNTVVALRELKRQKPAHSRPYGQPTRVHRVEVNFMSHVDSGVRRALSSRLCPAHWLPAHPNGIPLEPQEPDDSAWLGLEHCP